MKLCNLRIRCHLHYGRECDEAFHPAMQRTHISKERLKRAFILSEDDIAKIIGIFRVILPLHRLFKEVCRTGNFKPLSEETFYDDSLLAQAKAYEKLIQYPQAKKCYQQALALNPDDAETQLHFARTFISVGRIY